MLRRHTNFTATFIDAFGKIWRVVEVIEYSGNNAIVYAQPLGYRYAKIEEWTVELGHLRIV